MAKRLLVWLLLLISMAGLATTAHAWERTPGGFEANADRHL